MTAIRERAKDMGKEVLLSSGEIGELAAFAGVPPPLLLAGSSLHEPDALTRLRERQLVAYEAGQLQVVSWLEDVLRVLGHPEVAATVHVRGHVDRRYSFFGIRGLGGAIHQPLPGGLHRLGSLIAGEVVECAIAATGLVGGHPAPAVAFTVTAGDLDIAWDRAARGLADDAVAALRGGGATAAHARAFAAALAACQSVASVTVVGGLGGGRIVGATVGWLDGSSSGLWRIEGPNLAVGPDASGLSRRDWYDTAVGVQATTAAELRGAITAGFSCACAADGGLRRSGQSQALTGGRTHADDQR
jgi:hypothetical protein